MDQIVNSFLDFDEARDLPLNEYFNMFGYEQKNSLRNMGSTALYVFISIALLFLILIVDLFGKLVSFSAPSLM